MTVYTWLVVLMVLPGVAFAEDFICTKVILDRTLYGLVRSQDPTSPHVQGCITVAKADTAQQRVIDNTVVPKYRKLVSNLMVEMTDSEKTTADVLTSAEVEDAALKADATSIISDTACTATKSQIETHIAALDTIADLKQFLVKLTECMLVINGRLQT